MPLSPTDLITLSRLLDEAMDLAPEQVEDWLSGLGPEHEHLKPRLQEMLASHRESSHPGFMADGPKLATVDETVAREGEVVGPYRLIREIGHGGMGTVWLAERADGTLKRQIALKLPRLAWGAGLAERMARERDIGALLEHPNIARLYDAGVDAKGRPYLALEYIDGQPLDAWCETKGLSTRDRLKLFVQVARAVAYAHGRLVVHRDLKPSNVLVTLDGQAHLLDFGIAKLLHEAGTGEDQLTQEQGRVLTPHYASPEQIRGETITVASDVYSLGVLLYELLTGRYPYEPQSKSLAAIEAAILNDEPALASSRAKDKGTARALRGDMDAILAKALRREPTRRYATADALVQDIQRHLNGDTVSARPDSVAYRLYKVARRHWVSLVAASIVACTILVGGSVTLIQTQRAARQAERARIVTQFVSEMFRVNAQSSVDERKSEEVVATGRAMEPAARLIDTRFAEQPELQAQLYGALGQVYAELGITRAAVEFGIRQLKAMERDSAPPESRARALMLLAEALGREGKFVEALARAQEAVNLLDPETALAFDTKCLLATLQSANNQRDRAKFAIGVLSQSKYARLPSMGSARLLRLKAVALYGDDRAEEAFKLWRSAIAMASTVEGESSDFVLKMMTELTRFMSQVGRQTEAQEVYEDALRRLNSAGDLGKLRSAVLTAYYLALGGGASNYPYVQVRRLFEDSLATVRRFGSAVPLALDANIQHKFALVELGSGDVDSAYRRLSRAIPILRASTDQEWELWDYAENLGTAAMLVGRHDEAERELRDGMRMRESQGFKNEPWAAYDWVRLAYNMMMQGRIQDAEQLLKRAPRFGELKSDALDGSEFASAIPKALARMRLEADDPAGALRALPAPEPSEPAHEYSTLYALHAIRGEALCAVGLESAGLSLLSEWIAAVSPKKLEFDIGLARVQATAAVCALKAGDRVRAEALGGLARQTFERQPAVSAWYKKPLEKLEEALRGSRRAIARGTRSAQLSIRIQPQTTASTIRVSD